MEVHEQYQLAQAWPGYEPELTGFQFLAGIEVHRMYEQMKQEKQVAQMKAMFGG